MTRWFDGRSLAALALGAALSMTFGCEGDASGLTEWTPDDHDHQAEPRMRRTMANMAQKANPHAAPGPKNQVIDVTWAKQCATCHGKRGKGDGPSSTMVKARDLTNADFQATLSDEQIAKVIRNGKDKMPAFNLPDSIIEGLVQHVRGLVRKKRAPGDVDRGEHGDDEDESVQEAVAPAAAPNAPASTGTYSPAAGAAPSSPAAPSAPAPGGADTTPHAPTRTPPAPAAPTAVPRPPAPSAPPSHP